MYPYSLNSYNQTTHYKNYKFLFIALHLNMIFMHEGDIDAMVQLVEVAANSTSLKKLTCDKYVYEHVLSHVPKQYRYILHEGEL